MPTIREKEVTYSDPSLKLGIERKYAIELMPVKSYEKDLVFPLAKAIKDITYHSLKLKCFHSSLFHLKQMPHFITMLPSILDPSRLVKNLSP